jgi:hypothetical protein
MFFGAGSVGAGRGVLGAGAQGRSPRTGGLRDFTLVYGQSRPLLDGNVVLDASPIRRSARVLRRGSEQLATVVGWPRVSPSTS